MGALDRVHRPERTDTIADFAAVREHGVEGNAEAASVEILAELAGTIPNGTLEVPIARTCPLDRVRDAYRAGETPHPRQDRAAAVSPERYSREALRPGRKLHLQPGAIPKAPRNSARATEVRKGFPLLINSTMPCAGA